MAAQPTGGLALWVAPPQAGGRAGPPRSGNTPAGRGEEWTLFPVLRGPAAVPAHPYYTFARHQRSELESSRGAN